jgi:hypothetical protein
MGMQPAAGVFIKLALTDDDRVPAWPSLSSPPISVCCPVASSSSSHRSTATASALTRCDDVIDLLR